MGHVVIFVTFLLWFVYLPAVSFVSLLRVRESDWLVQTAVTAGMGIAVVTLTAFVCE